jgi:SOS response regulatory protein OraA/RecX
MSIRWYVRRNIMSKKPDISWQQSVGEVLGEMLEELDKLEKENHKLRESLVRRGVNPDQIYKDALH